VDVDAAYRFVSSFSLPPGAAGFLSLERKQMHLITLR
jgi:hypothetical protein